MSNQSDNEKKMAMASQTGKEKSSDEVPPNTRRSVGLLPTPTAEPISVIIDRQFRRSRSDGDAYGRRPYTQARQSAAIEVNRCQDVNTGAFNQGFKKPMPQYHQQSQRGEGQRRPNHFMKPQYDERRAHGFVKSQAKEQKYDRYVKPVQKVSAQGEGKESTDAKASTSHVQGRRNGGNAQQVVARRRIETCPPFCGPFPTVNYGPAPTQDQAANMYKSMLWSSMFDNRIPTWQESETKTNEGCMRYANNHSFGSFVMTDSKHGNGVMPTFPRI